MRNGVQQAEQLLARCDALAAISEMDGGICRRYLTPEHKTCNVQVAKWMTQAGMRTWQDEVGNQWGRLASQNPDAKRLIIGSHLDTVPNAGAYDGILGVLLGVELAQYFHDNTLNLPFHLDVVGFCDEEGTRFGTTLIGSSALAGQFNAEWLSIQDNDGISMRQAMRDFGLDPEAYAQAALNPHELKGYLEAHIEQGPVLESQHLSLGIVTAIAGARRANFTFIGQSGHAGTTPMGQRKDAAAAACELTMFIEQLANQHADNAVATVGCLTLKPAAVNVIAGSAELSLDIRSQDDDLRDELCQQIEAQAVMIAEKRQLDVSVDWYHSAPAVPCDDKIQQQLSHAFDAQQLPVYHLPSGAGHDAMAIAELTPVGMLFIRSPQGLSHHPDESVLPEDIAHAFSVCRETLNKLTN